MPFFFEDLTKLKGSHEARPGYSKWNQTFIIDGSGVYITRNQDYRGTVYLSENTAFDNGINGLVVHKTNHATVRGLLRPHVSLWRQRSSSSLNAL